MSSRIHLTAVVAAVGLLALGSVAEAQRGRPYTEMRDAAVNASGARRVVVEAAAGSLRIVGRSGLSQVRVKAELYAEREGWLRDMRLEAERDGDVVRVRVDIPETRGLDWGSRGMNLEIEVPDALPLDVRDGSGDAYISTVGPLRVADGSGDLEIERVDGDVEVEDGSGTLTIRDARGEVSLRDGSGDVVIRGVTGSVTVEEDGSGEIDATDVSGTVHVRDDGSGSIVVADVGGDFIVDHDGSGGVRHRGVRGEVRVPRRR